MFDPLHYLALIEQKINALDQAAPLVGWPLPEEFAILRRLLEACMGKQGKRESFMYPPRLSFKVSPRTDGVRSNGSWRRLTVMGMSVVVFSPGQP